MVRVRVRGRARVRARVRVRVRVGLGLAVAVRLGAPDEGASPTLSGAGAERPRACVRACVLAARV